jgi:hypothetical protein
MCDIDGAEYPEYLLHLAAARARAVTEAKADRRAVSLELEREPHAEVAVA